MGLRLAICQCASTDDVHRNLKRIEDSVSGNAADLYLFPELFLTRYGNTTYDAGTVSEASKRIGQLCREKGIAIAVGMPVRDGDGLYNSLMLFTPEETVRYDKLYLANFAPYNEGIFTPGKGPVTAEWKGVKIGLVVCYDVMFPEIHRYYALHGADLILVSSASAEKSRNAMETIVPARSLENTVYTAFCNNIGEGPAGRFFGGSCMFSPLGAKKEQLSDSEGVLITDIDPEEICRAREIRHHLEDYRSDIVWN